MRETAESSRAGYWQKFENTGRVEDYLAELLAIDPFATVVLDPPRAGVDRSVLRAIESQKIGKVIFISCDPATLARDVGILTGGLIETESGELVKSDPENGAYAVELVQPFDMFPQTKHVETVVLMSKVQK